MQALGGEEGGVEEGGGREGRRGEGGGGGGGGRVTLILSLDCYSVDVGYSPVAD